MQAEWMGNLPELNLRCAYDEVIRRDRAKAVGADTHIFAAVAKARNIPHLNFIEIPFLESFGKRNPRHLAMRPPSMRQRRLIFFHFGKASRDAEPVEAGVSHQQ